MWYNTIYTYSMQVLNVQSKNRCVAWQYLQTTESKADSTHDVEMNSELIFHVWPTTLHHNNRPSVCVCVLTHSNCSTPRHIIAGFCYSDTPLGCVSIFLGQMQNFYSNRMIMSLWSADRSRTRALNEWTRDAAPTSNILCYIWRIISFYIVL